MSVTLYDIARECGRDVSTVSRALRGDERVKPETREEIRALAERMGYVPNLAARSLKAGRTGVIQFLVPHLNNALEREPAEAASRYLYGMELDLQIGIHHNDEAVYKRLLDRLLQGGADGAIVIPGSLDPDLYRTLVRKKFPLVFLDRHPEGLDVPVFTTDNRGAAAEMVRRCADNDIGCCISLFRDHNPVERARRDGTLTELGNRQIPVVIPEEGRLTEDAAARLPERIAVMATQQNPVRQFLEDNKAVLKDKALFFGVFDGWSGEPYPAQVVHSVIQDFSTMARLAVDRILMMIEGGVTGNGITPVPPKEYMTVRRTF